MLLDGARAAAGDLDRGDQGGQRGAELVRRLAGELPLPLQRHVQAVEEPVEAAGEVLQLVARPRAGQPAVVEGHGAGRLGHEGQRGEGASAEMTADRRGQRPEAQRDQRQDGRQRSDLGLHRLERGPRGQHTRRALAARRRRPCARPAPAAPGDVPRPGPRAARDGGVRRRSAAPAPAIAGRRAPRSSSRRPPRAGRGRGRRGPSAARRPACPRPSAPPRRRWPRSRGRSRPRGDPGSGPASPPAPGPGRAAGAARRGNTGTRRTRRGPAPAPRGRRPRRA